MIVAETNWNYSAILNNNDIKQNNDTKSLSGLKTESIAAPYTDMSTMDITKMLYAAPYALTKKVSYINLSKKGCVYVRSRDLNVFSISPITNVYAFSKEEIDPPEQLLIVEEYKLGDSRSALESLHLLEISRAVSSEDVHMKDREFICNDLRQVVKNLSDKVPTTYGNESPIILRFTRYIPLRDIREKGILHLVNLDITVSLDRRMCLDPFPDRIEDVDKVDESRGYNLSIEIIDNNDIISSKYIKGNKDAISVPIIKDPLLPNSLRIKETINGEVINNVISDLTIESLSNHGVYSSKEEALTANDPKLIKLIGNLDKLDNDYKDLLSKYDETSSNYKKTINELEKEVTALKRQIRIMEDTAEDIPVTQTDWSGVFGDSLENVGKFASTASKTADLISKLSKFKR